jgi:hypothetical protein
MRANSRTELRSKKVAVQGCKGGELEGLKDKQDVGKGMRVGSA